MNQQARNQIEARKLGKRIKASVPPPSGIYFATGVVKTVTAGGSVDLVAMVEVTVDGTDTLAPYLLSYATPTVGHVVAVLFTNGSPLILGRVVGFPVF